MVDFQRVFHRYNRHNITVGIKPSLLVVAKKNHHHPSSISNSWLNIHYNHYIITIYIPWISKHFLVDPPKKKTAKTLKILQVNSWWALASSWEMFQVASEDRWSYVDPYRFLNIQRLHNTHIFRIHTHMCVCVVCSGPCEYCMYCIEWIWMIIQTNES